MKGRVASRSPLGDLPEDQYGMPGCENSRLSKPDFANDLGPGAENNFAVNRVSLQDVSRARAARLLRAAFPARSDRECARLAAAFLGVSDRQVLHWLSCDHSMSFDNVFAIGCRVGVFTVMEVMTQGESRASVLNLIIRGARRVVGR